MSLCDRSSKVLACSRGVLALLAFTGALACVRAGGADGVVKVALAAGKPDAAGKLTVTLTVDLNKGWHIYANPINDPDYVTCQTKVTVQGTVPPADVQVQYPAGKLDQHKLLVYQDKVSIPVHIQRAPGDTGPLEVSIRYNACNNEQKKCLAPSTVKIVVP